MPLLSGISYEELEESGRTSYSADSGWRGERIFIIDFADRRLFGEALLGWVEPIGDMGIRYKGQRFPGYDFLFCRQLQTEGMGKLAQGSEMASYTKAKITATYLPSNFGTSTTDTDEDYDEDAEERLAHLTEEWDFSGEFLTIPSGSFLWSWDAEPVEDDIGIMVGTIDIALTSSEEPLLHRDTIAAALGHVNSTAWYGFAAEHVLFLGAAARRTLTAEGITAWEITYRFRARAVPHNAFWREGVGWLGIEDTDGNPPYHLYNFYNLVT